MLIQLKEIFYIKIKTDIFLIFNRYNYITNKIMTSYQKKIY